MIDDATAAVAGVGLGGCRRLERRTVIQLGALGLALGFGRPPGVPEPPAFEALPWETFLEQLRGASAAVLGMERPAEDAYLWQVGSWMLRAQDIPEGAGFEELRMIPGGFLSVIHRRGPLFIARYRVDPGVSVALHDHPGHGVSVCASGGSLRMRSYEAVDGVPKSGGFVLGQTGDVRLTRGRVASLGTYRENFHRLDAGPEGASGLEIFTRFESSRPTRLYDLAEAPIAGSRDRFEARPRT